MKKKIFNKLLSFSNQYNFYKKNYNNLNNQNKKLKKRNFNLQLENIKLKKELGMDNKRNILNKLKNGEFSDLTVSIKSPNPKGSHLWGDYFYAKSLKKSFEKLGFNVFIHEREDWYHKDDEIVIVLRGLTEYNVDYNSVNVMWNISHPEDVELEEYEQYDFVFIASDKYARQIRKSVNTNVEPLLQCCDLDIFYPKENDNLKRNEVLFVGSTRKVYRKIIKDVLKTDHEVSIYGLGWESFIDEKYLKDEFIPNEMLNQYYSSCKILLNDHWDDMKEKGFLSNRLFDALACGAFIISDNMQEVDNIFEGNIVTYEDSADLDEKITYYLSHEEERINKALKGREIVIKNHTFDNRVEKIIESLTNMENGIF